MHLTPRPTAVAAATFASRLQPTRHGATLLGVAQCPLRPGVTTPHNTHPRQDTVSVLRLAPEDQPWLAAQAKQFERSAPNYQTRLDQSRYFAAVNALRQAQLHLHSLQPTPNGRPGLLPDRERLTLVAVRGASGPLLDPDRHAMIGILHGELPRSPQRQEAQILWLASGLNRADDLRGVGQVLVSQFYRLCSRAPVRHVLLTALTRTGQETQPNPYFRQLGLLPVWRHPEHLGALSPAYRDTLTLQKRLYGDTALNQLYLTPRRTALREAERIEQRFHWRHPASSNPQPSPSVPSPSSP